MFCRHCGKEIPEGSAFCPGCGKSQTAGKNPGGDRRKVTIILIAVIAVLIIIASTAIILLLTSGDSPAETPVRDEEEAESQDTEKEPGELPEDGDGAGTGVLPGGAQTTEEPAALAAMEFVTAVTTGNFERALELCATYVFVENCYIEELIAFNGSFCYEFWFGEDPTTITAASEVLRGIYARDIFWSFEDLAMRGDEYYSTNVDEIDTWGATLMERYNEDLADFSFEDITVTGFYEFEGADMAQALEEELLPPLEAAGADGARVFAATFRYGAGEYCIMMPMYDFGGRWLLQRAFTGSVMHYIEDRGASDLEDLCREMGWTLEKLEFVKILSGSGESAVYYGTPQEAALDAMGLIGYGLGGGNAVGPMLEGLDIQAYYQTARRLGQNITSFSSFTAVSTLTPFPAKAEGFSELSEAMYRGDYAKRLVRALVSLYPDKSDETYRSFMSYGLVITGENCRDVVGLFNNIGDFISDLEPLCVIEYPSEPALSQLDLEGYFGAGGTEIMLALLEHEGKYLITPMLLAEYGGNWEVMMWPGNFAQESGMMSDLDELGGITPEEAAEFLASEYGTGQAYWVQ